MGDFAQEKGGHPPKNIVIRMPNWLGDCVMATPLVRVVKNAFPSARLTAMCQKNVLPLLACDPHIDALMGFQRVNGWIHRECHHDILAPLRKEEFDLGILLTNSFSSAWWFWRGRVKRRIGFSGNFRSWMLSDAVPFPENYQKQHLISTYLALLEPLGIQTSFSLPYLCVQDKEISEAKTLLQQLGITLEDKKVIGINPGAAYGSAKCWPAERFREVTSQLLQIPNSLILYFGDASSASLVHSICNGFPERVFNLAGRTSLRELMAIISLCSVFLTNDSGPMHIAAALNIPLVALFGSTSPIRTGPSGAGPKRVLCKHVPCSPCYKRVCPIDFPCMKEITATEVYAEIYSLM